MKKLSLLLSMIPLTALAEDMPRGAFKSSEFTEARAAAKSQGKALIYIETDSKTTCPKTEWGTVEAYDKLKKDYILVVEDEADPACKKVSELNGAIIKTSKIGNFSPRVTVVEPEKLEFITGTDYSNMSSDKRWDKKLDEAVASKMIPKTEGETAPATPASTPATTAPVMTDWTNIEGKTIRAALIGRKADSITLKLENGSVVDYPLAKLSPQSKLLADSP